MAARLKRAEKKKEEEKLEGYLKSTQIFGEMIGEVLKEDEDKDRCGYSSISLSLLIQF